jgi:hypothetical protein
MRPARDVPEGRENRGLRVTPSRALTAAGLVLDLSGALLLWRYGLPEALSRDGSVRLICEQVDEEEIAKARHYDWWATAALCLISTGFGLQLLATFL